MWEENSMIKCLCVGLGGAVGAMLRYLIGLVPVGASNGFPEAMDWGSGMCAPVLF